LFVSLLLLSLERAGRSASARSFTHDTRIVEADVGTRLKGACEEGKKASADVPEEVDRERDSRGLVLAVAAYGEA
jgi:hypothetical protein